MIMRIDDELARDGESVMMIMIVTIWMRIGINISFDDDHEDWAASKPYRVGKDYDQSEHIYCNFDDCWDNYEQAKMGSWCDVDNYCEKVDYCGDSARR